MSLAKRAYPATANAQGNATATITPDAQNPWEIQQVSVSVTVAPGNITSSSATATIAVNGNFLCATASGFQDTASDEPFITLNPGESMTVTWTGCNNGDLCTAYVIYDNGVD